MALTNIITVAALGVLLAAAAAPAAAGGAELSGRVGYVRDGDTIEVGGQAVRLSGLHAPELGKPGGEAARRFMIRLVGGEDVVCVLDGTMTYDRVVGVCYFDGQDIAAALVEAGLGRDCPRYSGGRYADLETPEARARFELPGYCEPR